MAIRIRITYKQLCQALEKGVISPLNSISCGKGKKKPVIDRNTFACVINQSLSALLGAQFLKDAIIKMGFRDFHDILSDAFDDSKGCLLSGVKIANELLNRNLYSN